MNFLCDIDGCKNPVVGGYTARGQDYLFAYCKEHMDGRHVVQANAVDRRLNLDELTAEISNRILIGKFYGVVSRTDQ